MEVMMDLVAAWEATAAAGLVAAAAAACEARATVMAAMPAASRTHT